MVGVFITQADGFGVEVLNNKRARPGSGQALPVVGMFITQVKFYFIIYNSLNALVYAIYLSFLFI